MKRVSLHLAFHHHQPVGNLDWVLEDVYQKCYWPIMEGIYSCAPLKVNLSYSAPVLRFLEKSHPEYLDLLRNLLDEGRAELLATGFYEPVLADLPEDDRRGQLELSRLWYQERFGHVTKGVWLSEAVWDKSLISTIRQVGMEYTLIRSERFIQAGLSPALLQGYYITEEIGETLAVFPNSEELQNHLPFGEISEFKPFLRRMANRPNIILTMADVAERWGAWPGTHQAIHELGGWKTWLDFFEEASDWVRFRCFSETLNTLPPQGKCYLPGGVSIDLGAWSLPDEARIRFYEARQDLEIRHDASRFLPFFRGGCWENFKGRYSEANRMNKKGLWLRKKLHVLSDPGEGPDPVAQDWLWQAQCNTAYWHGTSGGIYFPHLRQAVWERLLSAQRRMNFAGKGWVREVADVDGDSFDEILFYSKQTHIGFSPAHGGTVFEWSLLPSLHNFCNTLTRRHETAPHDRKFSEVSPTSQGAAVDPYERRCFHDRVISRKITVEQLAANRYPERANFIQSPYRVVSCGTPSGHGEVVLECSGFVEQGGLDQGIRVRKSFDLSPDGKRIACKVALTNEGSTPLEGVYAMEFNWCLSPQQEAVRVSVDGKPGRAINQGIYAETVKSVCFTNSSDHLEIRMESQKAFLLWALPLSTRQVGETSTDSVIQGHMVMPGWPFQVTEGKDVSFEILLMTPNVHDKKVD